ncbi:BREX-1 system adenine-specific DNA-methyltransferase PglX [Rhodococcus sp. IEGM 1408]|uniref:BREX-1 system adenine-specific DNA-methyltransferase PglX n=1 Tax=Rhodococcus sp. IEGM 1408 TaxID=3082220 RepID=UPI002955D69C|nr:BREX-1 system adenine-specific DNA-methyltransferase PglX [Rhodococcus sp. IEGM 1408]MDV8002810.1 BREX-1 system adenine-specific DNA-methyltransferase PglX [Rhodococcus sp. IEGM 1408]
MDTASLKSFATSARIELVREVGARISAVLAQGSPERVELARAVSALERVIAAGGGGDVGRAHVADKVAYIWFNRIVALRFMDANGYTGVGVVSPAADQLGQPEVLAAAKRGQVDGEVVKRMNVATIVGLLNGTRQARPGVDAQAEAYVLLLADYCRYWNGSMPSMFEREGDYTELLIPGNLLAEDSVLNRSVKVLTEEVCQDVEVIGWLYQFYISERKDEVFAGFKKNKKAGADEIPAATQLFTPHWIVRYLVENSLGRLWMLNHPESRLVDQMDYYIAPADEETDFLKITRPEELTVIDPACGSGHMLTYAFDLLYAIYEEEGYTPSQIPSLILSNNLYGTEIDPRAGALAAFALTMKAAAKRKLFLKNPVEPNICVLEPISFSADELSYLVTKDGDRRAEEAFWNQFVEADTFGALIQPDPTLTVRLSNHLATLDDDGDLFRAEALDGAQRAIEQAECLARTYAVAVANPPYMGTRNMGDALRAFAEDRYPTSSGDLCTMFIDRALVGVERGGLAALVVSESWLFTSTFAAFREGVIRRTVPLVTACIDKTAFGVRLNTAATVFQRNGRPGKSQFFRVSKELLGSGPIAALPPADEKVYAVHAADFAAVPGGAFIFDMPAALLALYGENPTVGESVDVKQGLATADNNRFVRFWWEVSRGRIGYGYGSRTEASASGLRWFPYNKGGTPVPWWGNQDYVVNWELDGREIRAFGTAQGGRPRSAVRNPNFYFRPSVTWSNIGSGGARFRSVPPGFVFDVAGMSAFPTSDHERLSLLGYLNTSVLRQGLDVFAPTLNYQVGDVARLPMLSAPETSERVSRLVTLTKESWIEDETAHEFTENPVVEGKASSLARAASALASAREDRAREIATLEDENERFWADRLAQITGATPHVSPRRVLRAPRSASDDVLALVSYAVGCMFGRYSLDAPSLILSDQGATLQEYLAQIPSPTFAPDRDNVIPIVDGDWFEDDIVERFRQFLRTAFGEHHFEENLRFVTESLGVKHLREYFVKSFYKDHTQRYKKRPIYWLFSSPDGSFNALIYMHRYTSSMVSTVLTYLREYVTKLESALQQAERVGNAKEADRLRKILLELNEYEHDTLYPKASENIVIDLDDGVKVNYPKFGAALKQVKGLEVDF